MNNPSVERARLDDAELLLRRYDPMNTDHIAFDQQTGQPTFRSGCLRWDREPDDPSRPADFHGISVTRDAILAAEGIPRRRTLQPPRYTGLAGVTAGQVRESSTQTVSALAVEDPLPANSEGDAHNLAHALIRVDGSASRNQRDRVASNVARRMRTVDA